MNPTHITLLGLHIVLAPRMVLQGHVRQIIAPKRMTEIEPFIWFVEVRRLYSDQRSLFALATNDHIASVKSITKRSCATSQIVACTVPRVESVFRTMFLIRMHVIPCVCFATMSKKVDEQEKTYYMLDCNKRYVGSTVQFLASFTQFFCQPMCPTLLLHWRNYMSCPASLHLHGLAKWIAASHRWEPWIWCVVHRHVLCSMGGPYHGHCHQKSSAVALQWGSQSNHSNMSLKSLIRYVGVFPSSILKWQLMPVPINNKGCWPTCAWTGPRAFRVFPSFMPWQHHVINK